MAGMSGIEGNVAMAGSIGGVIKSWTANFTRASTDITGFGNATRNRAAGIHDVTGSMTGTVDSTLKPTLGFSVGTTPIQITLTAQTGNTVEFYALIDSVSVGVAVDGEATFSANFAIASTAVAFTSAVVLTWS